MKPGFGNLMPLICYVHRTAGTVPYFEILPDLTKAAALRRAAELMAERPDAVRAELWDGEQLVHTLDREPAA